MIHQSNATPFQYVKVCTASLSNFFSMRIIFNTEYDTSLLPQENTALHIALSGVNELF